jgi:hypothetical protein
MDNHRANDRVRTDLDDKLGKSLTPREIGGREIIPEVFACFYSY